MARAAPESDALRDAIDRVRRFNRFYTRRIGALDEGHLDSEHTLTQVRVLYELAHREQPSATEIGRDLGLDPGYLSRMLRGFADAGLVTRTVDGRRNQLRLTARGRRSFTALDVRARAAIAELLQPLDEHTRTRVLAAMETIQAALASAPAEIELRAHRPGDMGMVVARQSILYAREYGWNSEYEALASRLVADFLAQLEPERERCWIADRHGEMLGAVFVMRHRERDGVARLRLLHVEPDARGHGLGRRLVHTCTEFARAAGYHTLTLWTNSVLVSARRIYEAEGYRLVDEHPHHAFGHDLVSQTWDLPLARAPGRRR